MLYGLWEWSGDHTRSVEDRGGVVNPFDDDGASLRAGCHNDARVGRAALSGKWGALVAGRVGGNNIPCAEAHRGCCGYGVDVGHDLESLKVVWVLLLKCCGEMRECGRGQSGVRFRRRYVRSYKVRSDNLLCAIDDLAHLCLRNRYGVDAKRRVRLVMAPPPGAYAVLVQRFL